MENLGGEVAAEDAPCWAVSGGADVMLVAVEKLANRWGFGTVGEKGTVLNEGFVS